MTSLEPLFDTLSRLSIDTLLRGAILLLVGYVLIRLILKLVRRALNRTNLDAHISHTLITACRLVLYFILLTMVMGQLGISSTSLVTLLGVFGLALSLALQDTLSNIAGGLFVLYTKPFKVGDYVELWGVEGTVQLIGFIHTTLTTIDNKLIYVPNGQLSKDKIINYSARGIRRIDHAITASYDDSTEAVRAACLRAVEHTPNVLADPAPAVVVTAYKESAVEYHVRFWTDIAHFWDAYSFSLEEIRRCFAEDGVTMTYNHLNVHILDKTTEK